MVRAAIIAGGLGTRARGMTHDRIPKALLEVAGIPIVFRQLRLLADNNVGAVAIIAGHLGRELGEAAEVEGERLGLEISVLIEKSPLGTAGHLPAAREFLGGEDFLVVYGDMVFDVSLNHLLDFHRNRGALATIAAHPNDHPETSDLLAAGADGRLSAILPKKGRPPGNYRNLVPAALYALSDGVFDHLEGGRKADFIADVFPGMIEQGLPVYAYNTPEYLRDTGSKQRFEQAARDIRSGRVRAFNRNMPRPAVFFCASVLDEENAAEAVRRVNEAGHLAIAITVESGETLGRLETLLARHNAILDRICPGLSGAVEDLPVDTGKSALVTDTGDGIEAGLYAYGVRSGRGCRSQGEGARPDLMFSHIAEAVDFALGYQSLARTVAERLRSLEKGQVRPLVAAVCGRSQAGKSVLAHAVARLLADDGVRALHVRLDDWNLPAVDRDAKMGPLEGHRTGDYPALLETLLDDAGGARVVVLDGLFAADEAIRSRIDLVVFLDIGEPALRQRHMTFYSWKGFSQEEAEKLLAERRQADWPLVDRQKLDADMKITCQGQP